MIRIGDLERSLTNVKEQSLELKERNRLLSQKLELYDENYYPSQFIKSGRSGHPLEEMNDYYNSLGSP